MRKRVYSAFGLLAAAAILQAALLWSRNIPKVPEGPSLGDTLPTLRTYAASTDDVVQFGNADSEVGSCMVLVAISTSCGVCGLMRDEWNDRYSSWLDSVGAPVRATWIAAADSDTLEAFLTSGDSLDQVRIVRMSPDDSDFRQRLGVYATPTIYLLDRQNRLRIGSLGFNLPPADSAATICRDPA